jgi:hypothetical protein
MHAPRFPVLAKNFPFILYYRGKYKTDLSINIFEIVNANLSLHFKKSFVTRLSYLVIECIQNVIKYSESKDSSSDYCLIYSDENFCHVVTGNRISYNNVENLENRLFTLKKQTIEEIEEAYNSVLRSKTYTTKGAGLGLIDIARKTGKRMEYTLQKESEEEWFYSLHIKLPLPSQEIISHHFEEQTESIIKSLIDSHSHNENTFLYSGDFSNTFLINLLDMITGQYKNERSVVSSIFNYALIELNQNIHQHATSFSDGKIPGLLAIEWLKESMTLSTSNFISEGKCDQLCDQLNLLKQASKEELNALGEEKMNDMNSNGGLGLIDTARLNWPRPIQHSFHSDENLGKSVSLKIEFEYEHRTI